ncbi:MAG: DUF1636 domain-containing protein [Pseudomonadota bacterium]
MTHRITICTSCRHKGTECRPGYTLIERLRQAIGQPAVPEDFEVSGVACMEGCDRPCTVAYHGTKKATYLFGDVDPDTDVDDLVAFAKQYAYLHEGWCSSADRPGKLGKTPLARVPAAILAIEESQVQAS